MTDAEIEKAIEHLEDALSDLRWALRGGRRGWYVSKARAATMRAEDHLDSAAAEINEAT